jgi:pentatricopeptide repeat protein
LATTVFQRVLGSPLEANVAEVASALNGLAGILSRRGQYDEAIKIYQGMVAAMPGYAWHDLFAALDLRARQTQIDVDLMLQAVERVR